MWSAITRANKNIHGSIAEDYSQVWIWKASINVLCWHQKPHLINLTSRQSNVPELGLRVWRMIPKTGAVAFPETFDLKSTLRQQQGWLGLISGCFREDICESSISPKKQKKREGREGSRGPCPVQQTSPPSSLGGFLIKWPPPKKKKSDTQWAPPKYKHNGEL